MKKDNSNLIQAFTETRTNTNPKIGFVFVFLIVLLFYSVPLLAAAAGADATRYTDYLYLYTVTSYSIIILSIIIFQRTGFVVFHDHFSLWVIVLGCFLAAIQGGKHETVYKIFLLILAVRLAIYIIGNRGNFQIPSLKSVVISLTWSGVTIVIISLLLFSLNPVQSNLLSNFSAYFLNTFLYQVAFVTVIEEACFRGLIFGFLVMNGYEEDRALIIQAILFWGIHYLKVSDIPLFFVALPLLTLSLTLIIKKYKILYMSVMVHTFANILVQALVVALYHLRT